MKAPRTPGGIEAAGLGVLGALVALVGVVVVARVELAVAEGGALLDAAVAVGFAVAECVGVGVIVADATGWAPRGVGLPDGIDVVPLSCPLIPKAAVTITAVQPAAITLGQVLLARPLMASIQPKLCGRSLSEVR